MIFLFKLEESKSEINKKSMFFTHQGDATLYNLEKICSAARMYCPQKSEAISEDKRTDKANQR